MAAGMTPTKPPTVSVTAPTASGTVSGLVAVDVSSSDNVGVVRAELRVNGKDRGHRYQRSVCLQLGTLPTTVANGMANLSVVAFDAAGQLQQLQRRP